MNNELRDKVMEIFNKSTYHCRMCLIGITKGKICKDCYAEFADKIHSIYRRYKIMVDNNNKKEENDN